MRALIRKPQQRVQRSWNLKAAEARIVFSPPRLAAILAALTITATAAAAQGVTVPTNNSQSGIQTVLTQKRDSLQRASTNAAHKSQHQALSQGSPSPRQDK
jgi:hypothetical protein